MGVKGEGLYNLLSENQEFRSTVSIAKADEVKELFRVHSTVIFLPD